MKILRGTKPADIPVEQIAAMADSKVTQSFHIQALEQGAQSRGVALSLFGISGPEEIASAIDAAKASGAEALNFLASPLFSLPANQSNGERLSPITTVRTATQIKPQRIARTGRGAKAMQDPHRAG